MSTLRKRFIRDLKIQNYSDHTISNYVSSISLIARHYDSCPSHLSVEQIKNYISHLRDLGRSWSTINLLISALNTFYMGTLGQPQKMKPISRPKKDSKIPHILSPEEVTRLLMAVRNLKHRTLLMTIYAGGLRISEACNLKTTDIDSARMRIIVRNAKGHKDREVLLSKKLLKHLRVYYQKYRPDGFLFPGRDKGRPYSQTSTRVIFRRAVNNAGLTKKATTHTLRHSYATHLMESGIDIRIVQSQLGHKSLRTTMQYCHLTDKSMAAVRSPFDDLSIS
jgi:site-specific recombinase XerD